MAGIVKRVAAVLVSIVWLSFILILLAGFFAPNLHQLLPAPVREYTDPEALRERWQSFTDSVVTGIGMQPSPAPEATETPTPDAALPPAPTATPLPESPTATPPPAETPTPTTDPAMTSDEGEETPALETTVSVSVSEAGQADLRSAPSEDADVIGLVAAGGKVNIDGQDATGDWYRLEDGTWINAADLVEAPSVEVPVVLVGTPQPPEGSEEPPPASETTEESTITPPEPVRAVVNADSNLRAGPGIEYDRVDGINFGEETSIVGISTDGEWYLLERGVWLFAALITEAVDVPVVTEDTLTDQAAAPDSEQPETAQADTGEQEEATEQTQADTEQTDSEQPDPDDEQTAAETEQAETEQAETDAEQLQPVVIALRGANLRAGPGAEFDRVDGAEEGQVLTITAQDDSGEWLKLEDGSWIFAALVENVPADLPVESEEAAEDEQEAQAAEDEQDVQTAEDEQEAQPAEDEQDVQTAEDEQEAQPAEDEQDVQTAEDEQEAQAAEDEQDAQTDEDEEETQEEIAPVLFGTVNTDANLRNGPGLDATIVESASADTLVTIVARSDDEQWLQLENGFWIFAALVDILPADGEDDTDGDAGTDGDDSFDTIMLA
jgi:uncharacterized protein YgiM (DUF1202 family)